MKISNIISTVAVVSIPLSFISVQNVNAEEVGNGLDLSANVSIASDYIWRGDTQTNGSYAIQGGLDLTHDSGLYLGNWNSNVVGGSEVDLYGGLNRKLFNNISYDVGAIGYVYPHQKDLNFYEIYAGLSYEKNGISPSVKGYVDPYNNNDYVTGGVDFGIGITTASVNVGYVIPDEGENLYDYSLGLTVPVFTLDWGITYTDKEDGDNAVFVSVGKSF